jgi:protein-S-isoprenylcysteine O-methyltransferase Ste14
MLVLIRTIIYASVFSGIVLIVLPQQILKYVGIVQPETIGLFQIIGIAAGLAGGAVALWCVFAFAFIGRGTPAPFDPPRRLVIRGPYRFVRNPMYIGAGIFLFGIGLYFEAFAILLYTVILGLIVHLFIIFYEEPVLKHMFGAEYESYRQSVNRWLPGRIK